MNKERLILVGALSAYLGPVLDHLAIPPKDQPAAVGWLVAGIFAGYHVVAAGLQDYWPRIRARTLDKWFPPIPAPPVPPIQPPAHP